MNVIQKSCPNFYESCPDFCRTKTFKTCAKSCPDYSIINFEIIVNIFLFHFFLVSIRLYGWNQIDPVLSKFINMFGWLSSACRINNWSLKINRWWIWGSNFCPYIYNTMSSINMRKTNLKWAIYLFRIDSSRLLITFPLITLYMFHFMFNCFANSTSLVEFSSKKRRS